MTETDFSPGDMVFDRDDDNADPALVVNCIPGASADEWNVLGDQTVAEANPDYPADASVIAVVFKKQFDADAMEWNREEPIALTEVNDSPMDYYSFPAPRLVRDEHRSAERPDESNRLALTDIQHVGENRADALREAGYESAENVVTADEGALAKHSYSDKRINRKPTATCSGSDEERCNGRTLLGSDSFSPDFAVSLADGRRPRARARGRRP